MRDFGERKTPDNQFRAFLSRMPEGQSFGEEDRTALRALAQHAKAFPDKHVFKYYGEEKPNAVLILDGVAARVRVTEKGARRILGFVLAGELSIAPTSARHSNYELVAQGPCIAVTLPWQQLRILERDHKNIRQFLEWYAQKEIRALEDKFVAMSGAQVEEKLVYLLEDIYSRLQVVEKANGGRMSLPIKQQDIADAVGASVVQVSKTLSKMRRGGRMELEYSPAQTTFSLPEKRG